MITTGSPGRKWSIEKTRTETPRMTGIEVSRRPRM
jgi:hypothetical protein